MLKPTNSLLQAALELQTFHALALHRRSVLQTRNYFQVVSQTSIVEATEKLSQCDHCPAGNGRKEALRGVRDAAPVLIGFLPFALVLGSQAAKKGLTSVEVLLMTGLNFAGGSEFAAGANLLPVVCGIPSFRFV